MTRLAETRTRSAASPDILLYPDAPGWTAARETLGLHERRPAAIGLPRTATDVAALVAHADTVGLALAVHHPGERPPEPLHGTVLVSLRLLTADELSQVPHVVRAPDEVCDDPSNGEVGEAR
jgi:hypothetical protein